MRRVALVTVAAAYWLALLVATITATALGDGSRLWHPLYALCLLGALVLALAVLRWPPRRPRHRPSPAVGTARPPRPRSAEPAWTSYQPLTEVTQLVPPVVVERAPEASPEPSPVVVAEREGESTPYDSGYMAGATGGQTPPRDSAEARGFVAGALDFERARSDDDEGFPGVSRD